MGEIEDRLKIIDSGKPVEKPKLKSEIEKALEEADTQDAKDILRAQARRRKAEEEARAREAEARLRQTGGLAMTEEERREEERRKAEEELKTKTERIEQAKALYTSCIEAGGDPKRCADMVAGLIPSPTTAAAPPATSITELVTALKALDDLRGSDRGLGELKQSFEKLAEEIRRGNTTDRQPLDPIAFAKQQAGAVAAWHKAIQELTPPPVTSTGEPLEVVQERHRHEEKMEEVKADKAYKEKLGETMANLPESIGRGLGRQIIEGEESKGGGGGGLDSIVCECGNKIHITPGADRVTCGKCGTIYSRTGEVETKQE